MLCLEESEKRLVEQIGQLSGCPQSVTQERNRWLSRVEWLLWAKVGQSMVEVEIARLTIEGRGEEGRDSRKGVSQKGSELGRA